jgi:hypothetical protein
MEGICPFTFLIVSIFRLDVDSSGPLYPDNCSSFTLWVFFVTLCDVIVNFLCLGCYDRCGNFFVVSGSFFLDKIMRMYLSGL